MSPKKTWQRQKSYADDHLEASASARASPDGHDPFKPSLIDRIGAKVTPPRSLLERMELDGPTDVAQNYMGREKDGEILIDAQEHSTYYDASEDVEVMVHHVGCAK